jgi:hypothetical protein
MAAIRQYSASALKALHLKPPKAHRLNLITPRVSRRSTHVVIIGKDISFCRRLHVPQGFYQWVSPIHSEYNIFQKKKVRSDIRRRMRIHF